MIPVHLTINCDHTPTSRQLSRLSTNILLSTRPDCLQTVDHAPITLQDSQPPSLLQTDLHYPTLPPRPYLVHLDQHTTALWYVGPQHTPTIQRLPPYLPRNNPRLSTQIAATQIAVEKEFAVDAPTSLQLSIAPSISTASLLQTPLPRSSSPARRPAPPRPSAPTRASPTLFGCGSYTDPPSSAGVLLRPRPLLRENRTTAGNIWPPRTSSRAGSPDTAQISACRRAKKQPQKNRIFPPIRSPPDHD